MHRRLKDDVALVVALSSGRLRAALAAFADSCDQRRYHEFLDNLTPNDVYYARKEAILARRKQPQVRTLMARRKHYRREMDNAANPAVGTAQVYLNSTPNLSHKSWRHTPWR